MSLWSNRLARSAVDRKVGGSSPPRDSFKGYSQTTTNLFAKMQIAMSKKKFFKLSLITERVIFFTVKVIN